MLKKIRWPWRLSKKPENTDSSKPPLPTPTTATSRSIYRNIAELPLYLFIDAEIDGKLHSLVIEGPYTEIEIQNTWYKILDQFNAAMGDHESRLYLSLFKQIALKQIDIEAIEEIVHILKTIGYSDRMGKLLNNMLMANIVFTPDNPEQYQTQLQRCLGMKAGLKLSLDLKTLEFNAIKKRNKGKTVTPSREYFSSVLINLSDHAKYLVDDKITVFEYCERLRRLTKFLDKNAR